MAELKLAHVFGDEPDPLADEVVIRTGGTLDSGFHDGGIATLRLGNDCDIDRIMGVLRGLGIKVLTDEEYKDSLRASKNIIGIEQYHNLSVLDQ